MFGQDAETTTLLENFLNRPHQNITAKYSKRLCVEKPKIGSMLCYQL